LSPPTDGDHHLLVGGEIIMCLAPKGLFHPGGGGREECKFGDRFGDSFLLLFIKKTGTFGRRKRCARKKKKAF